MSEPAQIPGSECARVSGLLPALVDGDLTSSQATLLEKHLETCAACRAALDDFAQIDCELTTWGRSLASMNPPPPEAREQLAARMKAGSARRYRPIRWITAAAAAIAAALAITVIAPYGKSPVANPTAAPFVGIPYLPPLDPRENTAVVHMNIRVATLIAAGYRIDADPEQIVPADVLVGEDGRAHAVRLGSDVVLN
jgi:hypothetical protein